LSASAKVVEWTDLSAPWRVCRWDRLDSDGQDDRYRAGQIGCRGVRDEMSMSDVGESGVPDAEVDPARVTLDDETLIVAAAVQDASERLYDPGACAWRWASATRRAGGVAVAFRAGVLCRPADVTACEALSRYCEVMW
jgi:hypothetical protein